MQFDIIGNYSNTSYEYYLRNVIQTEVELKIKKNIGEKIVRAYCEIKSFYFDRIYHDGYNVILDCYTEEEVNKNEETTINLNSLGYSRYIKFNFKKSQKIVIDTSRYFDEDIFTDLSSYSDTYTPNLIPDSNKDSNSNTSPNSNSDSHPDST